MLFKVCTNDCTPKSTKKRNYVNMVRSCGVLTQYRVNLSGKNKEGTKQRDKIG